MKCNSATKVMMLWWYKGGQRVNRYLQQSAAVNGNRSGSSPVPSLRFLHCYTNIKLTRDICVDSRWRSPGPGPGDTGDSVASWSVARADVRVTLPQWRPRLSRPEPELAVVGTGSARGREPGVTPWQWCSTPSSYRSSGSGGSWSCPHATTSPI